MTKTSMRAWTLALSLSAAPLIGGCEGGDDHAGLPAAGGRTDSTATPPPAPPGPGGGPPGMGMGGPASPIKTIMRKVAGGPNSLTPKLKNQLKAEAPEWDAIRAETKEYASLARELGTYDPPRGSKESWKALTDAFADHAAEMDRAAQAKDGAAASTARDQLEVSCKACHAEHQPPRGRGGPGGGFGPPPGGPPPGGQQPK